MTMIKKSINSPLAKAKRAVPLGWPPENILLQKEMFARKVVFDLDGPIVDWHTPFFEFASRLYGVKLDPKMSRYYSPGYDAGLPITPHQFLRAFEQFAQLSRGGYGDRPAHKGIVETFKALKAAGIKVEIWTWAPGAADYSLDTLQPVGTGIAQHLTLELIKKLGIVDDVRKQVRFVKPDAKPVEMAREHIPLIVEDHPVTAVNVGMSYGHACLLVPEPYNEGLVAPGILRLDNREDLAAVIVSFYEELASEGCLVG